MENISILSISCADISYLATTKIHFWSVPSHDSTKALHPPGHALIFMHRKKNLRPRQNGRHFPDDIFQCFFMSENVLISLEISLKFVNWTYSQGSSSQCCSIGSDNGLAPTSLLTHICVTRPDWVKCLIIYLPMQAYHYIWSRNIFHWFNWFKIGLNLSQSSGVIFLWLLENVCVSSSLICVYHKEYINKIEMKYFVVLLYMASVYLR